MKKINVKSLFAILFIVFLFFNLFVYIKQSVPIWTSVRDSVIQVQKDDGNIWKVMRQVITSSESNFQKKVWKREKFVGLNGLFLRVIGKDVVEDVDPTYDIYKMDNGQLTFTYPAMDVDYAVESMEQLQQYCKSKNVKLLYFQIPYKVNKYKNELPDGYLDGTNLSADSFLEQIEQKGIDYVDYRDIIHGQGIEYSDLFFDGDHHWTEETAFEAYKYLMNYFQETYDYPIHEEYLELAKYNVQTYPDSFLGSQTARVKELYADTIDDFTVIKPAFDTSYIHEIYNAQGQLESKKTKEGTFEKAVMSRERLKNMESAARNRDSVYLGHNPQVDVLTNKQEKEGNILILEDSFGRPFSAFTSLHFHKTHVMDLRYYEQSLIDYLEAHEEIEYVVVAYAATCFKESTYMDMFTF